MSFYKIKYLEHCHREMFGDLIVTCVNNSKIDISIKFQNDPLQFATLNLGKSRRKTSIRKISRTFSCADITIPNKKMENEIPETNTILMDELLMEIYNNSHSGTTDDYFSTSTNKSNKNVRVEIVDLQLKNNIEIQDIVKNMRDHISRTGNILVRQLKRRDALRRQQQAHCDVISRMLVQCAPVNSVPMRFSIQPPAISSSDSESVFAQWLAAMKMVTQLPESIPADFRRQLWLTMAERHLASRGIDWASVEKSCFSEWAHPTDAELGIQIVKDLHRTGCSLFCGEDGQENQALLKKVLLAYARWNKSVGYCQGFNMLAALILQVTEKSESEALKLMIYLIEGVLPDSYFADSLRGLSVDMAVFRELLRKKLPRLSRHLDQLQTAVKDGSRSYEPPLTNVFTMQWFLTLFCNCLPQPTVLRVWDLIFLEGNEILLRTALAIWQVLAQRIMNVRTADEFYSTMGILTRELLEFNLIDANTLIKAIVTIGPLHELKSLREHYLYNITPWGTPITPLPNKQVNSYSKTLPLDISALKKQYTKLRQRQKQAHVIFSGAISRPDQPLSPATSVASSQNTSLAINHLLVGKTALTTSAKRFNPPKVNLPPARQHAPSTLHWKDTQKQPPSSSSSDTELCDDDVVDSSPDDEDEMKVSKPVSEVKVDQESEDKETIKSNNNVQTETQLGDRLCVSPVNLKFTSDSEDDTSEFERFLADRISYLKEENNSAIDEQPSEVALNTRRNSERALQIIQENSIILHRIMQCQSRLSPSPPLCTTNSQDTVSLLSTSNTIEKNSNVSCLPEDDNDENNGIDDNEKDEKMQNVRLWIDENRGVFNENKRGSISEQTSPEYGTKYHSILEKSKSLDERYNNLILNAKQESGTRNIQASQSSCSVGKINTEEMSNINEESPETLVEVEQSNEQTKDDKSMKLIQENLDLLRSCSINKVKASRQKLLRENVDLLQSISGSIEKCLDLDLDQEQLDVTEPYHHKLVKLSPEQPVESGAALATLSENLDLLESTCAFTDDVIDLNPVMQLHTDILDVRPEFARDNEISVDLPTKLDEGRPKIDLFRSMSIDIDDGELDQNLVRPSPAIEESESIKTDNDTAAVSDLSPCNEHKISLQITDEDDDNEPSNSNPNQTDSLSLITVPKRSCDKNSSDKINSIKFNSPTSAMCLNLTIASSSSSTSSSGSRRNSRDKISPVKSPSHVFNPFPTALATRQNKEIPLKLGLYRNK